MQEQQEQLFWPLRRFEREEDNSVQLRNRPLIPGWNSGQQGEQIRYAACWNLNKQ